ncbi:MAG: hypothetical protein ABEJ56_03250 [Candidatus Nanohaloarchaea archaeon]
MEQDDYEDYLVDKAKEILDEQTESEKVEVPENESREDIEKAEEQAKSEIPFNFDPREIQHLSNNRKKMSNREIKEFLEKDSEVQERLEELDEWRGFNRWEERFLIQNNLNKDPEQIAEDLGRDEEKVRLKMRMLGLDVEF